MVRGWDLRERCWLDEGGLTHVGVLGLQHPNISWLYGKQQQPRALDGIPGKKMKVMDTLALLVHAVHPLP